jgi:ubiquitin carboxyl-terminal hydrolase 9/24
MVDIDFENMREKNEANYNPESARVRVYEKRDIEFGYILNWVQYFAELGGFDAIFNVLSMGLNDEKAVKAPFSIISYITRPFKNLNLMLTPEFAKLFSSRVSELTVQRLQNMSEKEVKNCSKEQVESVLFYLNQILTIGMTENERSWVIETTELNIALRFLKSSNLEKRLKGLQDIKTMIERVLKTHRVNKI